MFRDMKLQELSSKIRRVTLILGGSVVTILVMLGCSESNPGCQVKLSRGVDLYASYCGGCHFEMAGIRDRYPSLETMAMQPDASIDDPDFGADSLKPVHWHVERMSDCKLLNLKNYLVYFGEVEIEHLHEPRP